MLDPNLHPDSAKIREIPPKLPRQTISGRFEPPKYITISTGPFYYLTIAANTGRIQTRCSPACAGLTGNDIVAFS